MGRERESRLQLCFRIAQGVYALAFHSQLILIVMLKILKLILSTNLSWFIMMAMIVYCTNISFTCMLITHQSELLHHLNGGCDFRRQISLQKREDSVWKKGLVKFQVIEGGITRKNIMYI